MVVPLDAPERVAALARCRLLDSPRELQFDVVVGLAVELLDVRVALMTVVTHERQFFKASTGLSEPWASARQTPLSHSFCRHVVESGTAFMVNDARLHPYVRGNLAIGELGVVAYLGVPIIVDRIVLGSLCAIDPEPRLWRDSDLAMLEDLAGSLRVLITGEL